MSRIWGRVPQEECMFMKERAVTTQPPKEDTSSKMKTHGLTPPTPTLHPPARVISPTRLGLVVPTINSIKGTVTMIPWGKWSWCMTQLQTLMVIMQELLVVFLKLPLIRGVVTHGAVMEPMSPPRVRHATSANRSSAIRAATSLMDGATRRRRLFARGWDATSRSATNVILTATPPRRGAAMSTTPPNPQLYHPLNPSGAAMDSSHASAAAMNGASRQK
mmetsp:Transcript_6250/g.11200  ORF Transcript_6250/g.11200 Transcript_6250/m.11200 type:complete len:219 (+) Transcript_6250:667-1323(+)